MHDLIQKPCDCRHEYCGSAVASKVRNVSHLEWMDLYCAFGKLLPESVEQLHVSHMENAVLISVTEQSRRHLIQHPSFDCSVSGFTKV